MKIRFLALPAHSSSQRRSTETPVNSFPFILRHQGHLAGVLPIGLVILVFDKTKDNPRLYFKKMVL
jgi:hypothetical protein